MVSMSLKMVLSNIFFTTSASLWLKQWTKLIHWADSLNFTPKPQWIPVLTAAPSILRLASQVWRVAMPIRWKESSIQAFRQSAWVCCSDSTLRNFKTENSDEGNKNKTYNASRR